MITNMEKSEWVIPIVFVPGESDTLASMMLTFLQNFCNC